MATPMQSILSKINRSELITLTQQLIQIPSVYRPHLPGADESQVAHFIAKYLENLGLRVTMDQVVPGRPNVITFLDSGRPGKTLLLEAHADVIPEGDDVAWDYNPFAGAIQGNKIYGRGACDTKGNIAAALVALKTLKEAGCPFNGRVMFCVTVDEKGMMIGIKHFIDRGWAGRCDAAIICEPEQNCIGVAQKGSLWLAVRFQGKMAHGAVPSMGINPIHRMMEFIRQTEEWCTRQQIELGRQPLLGGPSCTPTLIQAPIRGEGLPNVIPASGQLVLDVRTVPPQKNENVISEFVKLARQVERLDPPMQVTVEVLEKRPWITTPMDSAIVKAAAAAYRDCTQSEPGFCGLARTNDGTYLSSLAGIPIIATGAGDPLIPHTQDEWVDIDELLTAAQIYTATSIHYLGSRREC